MTTRAGPVRVLRADGSIWYQPPYDGARLRELRAGSIRCKGVTAATGDRCRRHATGGVGYCHSHRPRVSV